MDRGKSSQGRGAKTKTPQYPADLFALGSKTTRPESSEVKQPGGPHSKRGASHSFGALGRSGVDRVKGSDASEEVWESVAIEVDPADLVSSVIEAADLDENDRVVALLCGAVKQLRMQRVKPDKILYLGLTYLAKIRPYIFMQEHVVEALCSLLRRDPALSFKTKGNPLVSVLTVNLLLKGFMEKKTWPEIFLKLYVEDSLGERVWVDHIECKGFVDNICTAISTRVPPKSLLLVLGGRSDSCPSPTAIGTSGNTDEETEGEVGPSSEASYDVDIGVIPRYSGVQDIVEQTVMDVIREQLNRRQPPDNITRNFLKLLSSTCGLLEVRLIVAPRLEMWLQNPKLMRAAQELLLFVCMNCSTHSQRDVEIISHLIKIRLKTKSFINLYLTGIRELIAAHPDNLATVLKHTIYNELSTSRNPNNMAILGVMFQAAPDPAASTLADVFQELLMNRDDYLRSLRALLREVVRVLRHDISLTALCRGLMQERSDQLYKDFEYKERMFVCIADLITLCVFLAISPSVREAASLLARGDKREVSVLQTFQMQVASIQRDAVYWLYEIVPKMYKPSPADFVHALHKVLFMEQPEQYYNKDNWPIESDRPMMLRLSSEVPVLQNTLLRIFIIGISKEHPLSAPDVLELADQLLKRTAALPSEGFPMLEVDKLEIIDLIFNLCAYHHPENITLPAGYCPPQLAISNLYWKAWVMLLVLSAHNPATIGSEAWSKYPTLRTFMEMCITNHFSFPPPTMAMGERVEEIRAKELQIAVLEKQQILEFESHLAAASTKITITEQTSLLLPQLITMDPTGTARKPPQSVLEQLKALNATHRMGHLLCRSRHPDFLLDIIQRQGASQSMPWLADLVENSEGALSHLPVQCLCEFLLSGGMQSIDSDEASRSGNDQQQQQNKAQEKHYKQQQLLQHLQTLVTDASQDPQASCEVLEYFLRRLSSPQMSSRSQAIKGLKMVLSSLPQSVEEEAMEVEQDGDAYHHAWLLRQLPALPHFDVVRQQIVQALRQACQVENDPVAVGAYICFLAQHGLEDPLSELSDLVVDMAQLIVERSTIIAAVLPSYDRTTPNASGSLHSLMLIFWSYLQKAREPRRETYTWTESQDQILVTWNAEGEATEESTMHILVVHAMIILLTYGEGQDSDLFDKLLDAWFPEGREPPKAFLMDTSEEALLIPDWLKLRMIRSNVERLVDAALIDLEAHQLVLFIQSFGIPVSSMSKLLHTLDMAVEADKYSVDEAVLDKTYMAQLVQVQHHRGATGGQKFVEVLQLKEPKLPGLLPEVKPISQPSLRKTLSVLLPLTEEGASRTVIPTILEQLFEVTNGSASWTPTEKHNSFRTLQKTLAMELQDLSENKSALATTVSFINKMLDSSKSTKFMDCLIRKSHFSCPLLRLMTVGVNNWNVIPPDVVCGVERISRIILNHTSEKRSPLANILKHFLQKHALQMSSSSSQDESTLPDDPLSVLRRSKQSKLEYVGQQLLDEGLRTRETNHLIEAMATLLLESKVHQTRIDSSVERRSSLEGSRERRLSLVALEGKPDRTGLLIDWLGSFEPEMIGSCPGLQMKFLFSKTPAKEHESGYSKRAAQSCRPYLLTLLTHRASWATLHLCVESLLQKCNTEYEPSSVLDFLWALTCNPKLWQGQDKYTPKHRSPEDALKLTLPQILSLIEYIIEEGMSVNGAEGKNAAFAAMESRFPLVLQCCCDDMDLAACAVRHLVTIIAAKSGMKSDLARQFLLLLYFRLPGIICGLMDIELDVFLTGSLASEWDSSILDGMSHTLLTALTSTPATKEWSRKSQEFELAARKMASVHPLLVLRQLPMLAASLRGRVHLETAVFRNRNHWNLFVQILGILELLQPHLFSKEYAGPLEETLDSFFSLFRNHGGQGKDMVFLLNRCISLLESFISHDAQRALKYLQKHAALLNDLQMMHPSLVNLRQLLSGISLPKQDGMSEEGGVLVAAITPSSSDQNVTAWTQSQIGPILAQLQKSHGDDVLAALQDIEHMSSRLPSILDVFFDAIAELLLSPSSAVRTQAHMLFARHLRQNPSASNSGLAAFLRCLDSDQAEVLDSALERLPEIVLCTQEYALMLLQKVFHLGMYSNVNTAPHISKAIAMLNLQAGC